MHRMKTPLLSRLLFAASALLLCFSSISTIHAAENLRLLVMLKSDVGLESPRKMENQLSQRIEKTVGFRLKWIGNTRTNAQIFDLPEGLDFQSAQRAVRPISRIDGVLWVEVEAQPPTQEPAQTKSERGEEIADISEFIIKLKGDNLEGHPDASNVQRLSDAIGHHLDLLRNTAESRVFGLGKMITASQAQVIEHILEMDPTVIYADPVTLVQPQSIVPNDPDFYGQWHLFGPSMSPGGANVQAAWGVSKGKPSVTVAIIDTGALFEHPDLKRGLGSVSKKSRYRGWDMISSALRARDGNGRDDYAGDEGDWSPGFSDETVCTSTRDSTWHGSHVSGIVAATTQNHQGVSGINWNTKLVPVRVLGTCGGTWDDVNDGIYWAAGHKKVPGTRPNKLSVNVINMSLVDSAACTDSQQAAIDFALAKGISVVVSAGNNTADVQDFSPASCRGVISVSSIGQTGDLSYYSNFGTGITLAAPGGETRWSIDRKGVV